jgi:hypothetical protein
MPHENSSKQTLFHELPLNCWRTITKTESWVRGNIDQARVGTGGAATEQNRLVLTDDGTRILLTVYPASSRVPWHLHPPPLAAELSPERAVSLCAELSEAAGRHLARRCAP